MAEIVYVAASARDARLTRICVASIRYFHPEATIRLLAGAPLQRGLLEELNRYWGVEGVAGPVADYGWGFVKLEPLFGPAGERFLVVDADTVFTGRVLDLRSTSEAPFLVDDEQLSEADSKRLYYDWDNLRTIDPKVQSASVAFNGGQWFGTSGLVTREEFEPWIEWTFPRQQRHPQWFMGGEQGILNCVILQKEALEGLPIHRRTIMRWPGHGLEGLDVESVSKGVAPALVIHWAGMKTRLLRNAVGGDLLQFFERVYYERLPAGKWRRASAICYHVWLQWKHFVTVRVVLAYRRWIAPRVPGGASLEA
jgi:hypothetical protein